MYTCNADGRLKDSLKYEPCEGEKVLLVLCRFLAYIGDVVMQRYMICVVVHEVLLVQRYMICVVVHEVLLVLHSYRPPNPYSGLTK